MSHLGNGKSEYFSKISKPPLEPNEVKPEDELLF